MPHSNRQFDDVVIRWVKSRFEAGSRVLDVGAGSGKWADVLGGGYHMSAIEVCEEYITRYALPSKYASVLCGDIREFPPEGFLPFDLILLGDVVEHLTPEEATALFDKIWRSGVCAVAVVPYLYRQAGTDENPHEEHLQDDLTHSVFAERYARFAPVPLSHERAGGVWVLNSPDPFKYVDQVEIGADELPGVRLAICTPHPGTVTTQYMLSMVETAHAFARMGVMMTVFCSSGALLDKVRNQMVRDVLSHPVGFTHILFVDSDQGWQANDLIKLLYKSVTLGKELIAYASVKKGERSDWAVNFLNENGGGELLEDGTMEVGSVGTGFMIVAVTAIKKMMAAFPQLAVRSVDGGRLVHAPNDFALFQCELDQEGRYWGEDITFCRRWRQIGGRVWVDPTGDLTHVGLKAYRGALMLGIKVDPGSPGPKAAEEAR